MNKKIMIVVVCCFSLLNSMQLPFLKKIAYGYCSQENGKGDKQGHNSAIRWRQEDTVSCIQETNGNVFVSLFDGHGGPAISTFLKNEFYSYFNQAHSVEGNYNIQDCLKWAFKKADAQTPRRMEGGFDWNGMQGSTALVGYFEKKSIFGTYECTIAWLGDSRAVVQDKLNNGVLFETEDHIPGNESEKERIEKAGGEVTEVDGISRVDGLSVSRAFGNKDLNRKLITQTPDIQRLTLTSEDGFVIFASDGIWNKISSKEAIDIVIDAMQKSSQELDQMYPEQPTVTWGGILFGEKDPVEEGGSSYLKRIARVLCYKAREKGSSDNLSVIIVNPMASDALEESDKQGLNVSPVSAGVNQVPVPKSQSWWSSQTPTVKKYIMGLSAALGLTALGSYLYYKFYGKN